MLPVFREVVSATPWRDTCEPKRKNKICARLTRISRGP